MFSAQILTKTSSQENQQTNHSLQSVFSKQCHMLTVRYNEQTDFSLINVKISNYHAMYVLDVTIFS